ncbi:MAG: hypothetical protein A2073_07310 [Deltaproteobacteria bacterium GWC2_42_11]|nr:MAG: hypothetical protein A2073_07310 [Deltaproteobacteria bacterium GWC2_42_11]HBO85155.1 hypothetical protein [Deltaproteobacteria bacterium]
MGLKEDLDLLDTKMNKLKVDYEQYFMRIIKREPLALRDEVDRLILKYSSQPINNTQLKFRYGTLTAKCTSLKQYWNRILRQIEEGTYERVSMVPDKARITEKEYDKPVTPADEPAPEDNKLKAVYQKYIDAKKGVNEPVNGITFEKFEKALSSQSEKVRSDYRCDKVEYKITVKDGKTKIVIIPVKG